VDSSINRERLRRDLQMVVGERSPFNGRRHLVAVENFIESELKAFGLDVQSDVFSYRGSAFRNIVGQLPGEPKGRLIILGAHFDSVPGSPGADDNASGVAVLLEATRLLAQARLGSQVLVCAFNLEELNMIGSTAFARKLKAADKKVDAMISLEMVGYTDSRRGSQKYPAGLAWFYPDRGDFIGVVGNRKSASVLRQFSSHMRRVTELSVQTLSVPGNGALVPGVRLSDHSPFWDLGYPALMVTDTAFFRNPNYHSASDRLDTLNIDFMARVCEGVVRGVIGLQALSGAEAP